MKFKEDLKTFFSLTKGERNGFLTLCIAMVFALIGVIYFQWIAEPALVDMTPYHTKFQQLLQAQRPAPTDTIAPELFTFNPNNLPIEDWVRLGLTKKQAASIHKYEAKGGTFKKKADLKRMYSISEEMFLEMEPFIDLPEQFVYTKKRYEKNWPEKGSIPQWKNDRDSIRREPRADPEPIMLELNSATEVDLLRITGIGEKTAAQIIKYRTLLGGYVNKDQIKEVYAFKNFPDHLPKIMEHVSVDSAQVTRIDVNTVDDHTLSGHPYIDRKVANAVVAYRNNHGRYKELNDIKKCLLIDDALFRKIAPYLTIE